MVRQKMMSKAIGTAPTTQDIPISLLCITAQCKPRNSIFRMNEFGSGDGIHVHPKRLKVFVIQHFVITKHTFILLICDSIRRS